MADLPPTEYLILEVLAARVRLGERMWTFPAKVKPALDSLQKRGLIWTRSAPTPRDYQAYLTDAGKREAFGEDYSPPRTVTRDQLADALSRITLKPVRFTEGEPGVIVADWMADAILEALDG
jgi:DNA-binding MarR family transcriptional regulator